MGIRRIHHVAYRCRNAKQSVEWYGKYLGMRFVLAMAEDHVPSTREFDPYMHVFLDAGAGNVLAFFELPNQAPMGRDEATPGWVQHLALQVGSVQELLEAKARLQAGGTEVLGPIDHHLFLSIYFFDPSGHRLELSADTSTPEMFRRLDEVKWSMLEEFDRTKRAPQHAAWLHGPAAHDGPPPATAE
jgi:catechol 2,3-dioxygenase-like lactoylglutathione lyase family enzyme